MSSECLVGELIGIITLSPTAPASTHKYFLHSSCPRSSARMLSTLVFERYCWLVSYAELPIAHPVDTFRISLLFSRNVVLVGSHNSDCFTKRGGDVHGRRERRMYASASGRERKDDESSIQRSRGCRRVYGFVRDSSFREPWSRGEGDSISSAAESGRFVASWGNENRHAGCQLSRFAGKTTCDRLKGESAKVQGAMFGRNTVEENTCPRSA